MDKEERDQHPSVCMGEQLSRENYSRKMRSKRGKKSPCGGKGMIYTGIPPLKPPNLWWQKTMKQGRDSAWFAIPSFFSGTQPNNNILRVKKVSYQDRLAVVGESHG